MKFVTVETKREKVLSDGEILVFICVSDVNRFSKVDIQTTLRHLFLIHGLIIRGHPGSTYSMLHISVSLSLSPKFYSDSFGFIPNPPDRIKPLL